MRGARRFAVQPAAVNMSALQPVLSPPPSANLRQTPCRGYSQALRCSAPQTLRPAMDDMLLLMTLATCTATAAALRMWQWLDEMGENTPSEDLP